MKSETDKANYFLTQLLLRMEGPLQSLWTEITAQAEADAARKKLLKMGGKL